jgi:hypothetical protein
VIPRLSLGIEYNPHADEVGPLVNVVALRETRTRPALMFGTSSDRIGTPDGQAYFGTLSKNLKEPTGLSLAPYVGLSYGTFEDKLRIIGGLWAGFGKGFSTTLIWDGVNLHPTVDYSKGRHTLSLLWVSLEDPGIAYSIAF